VEKFLEKHAQSIVGVLSGFDRLVFRGTLRGLAYVKAMMGYLWVEQVLLKNFGDHCKALSKRIDRVSRSAMEAQGRPVIYLPSCKTNKEELARAIAERDHIEQGPVCLLRCVEPCMSYEVSSNRDKKRLELKPRQRMGMHLYHYYVHPVFGFMNARIQTWLPLQIQVCLNGREWLGRQMDQAGLGDCRRDNTFLSLEDLGQAQRLLDDQLKTHWQSMLDPIARQLNPEHDAMFAKRPVEYYWSVYQSEWATDVMFESRAALEQLYPALIHHGMTAFGSQDVLRFLGRKLPESGKLPARFNGEVKSDYKDRVEGVRIKHWVDHNSIKLYDKYSNLRAETTMNSTKQFFVYRPKEGDDKGPKKWRPLRKGVADIHRRAQLSQAANERYLDALAKAADTTPLGQLTEPLCKPIAWKGTRVRALNPGAPEDVALLEAVNRGEFAINGLRNRDLRELLFGPEPQSAKEKRRQSAAVTRKLRLLRAHGLIAKLPNTHRYQVTDQGRAAITALLTARSANTLTFLQHAA